MSRKYDLIVWGASGFTGQLVSDYVSQNYPNLKLAIAGRNQRKLEQISKSLGLKAEIVIADLENESNLDAMCQQTRVLISTAGPFAIIGTPIVAACVRNRTHYCDITGEGQWYRTVIDKYHEIAKEKKIKIIPSCGLDCVPSDLGALMMVEKLRCQNVRNISEVRMVIDSCTVSPSGGTLASVLNIFDSCSLASLLSLLNPYYLNPKLNDAIVVPPCNRKYHALAGDSNFVGYDLNFVSGAKALFNKTKSGFVAPWMMQIVNTRIVNRSNALSQWEYGEKFVYSERMRLPILAGLMYTIIIQPLVFISLMISPIRWIIKQFLPQSGEGSSNEAMKSMGFHAVLWGKGFRENAPDSEEVIVYGSIDINGCPGYLKTAVMLSECAVSLVEDVQILPTSDSSYGVVTPAVGIGKRLLERFNSRDTGIKFYSQ